MAGEKVLIIDPEREDVHSLIEELLYPEGYIVVHALEEKKVCAKHWTGILI
jgi:hypothetical protein